MTGQFGWASTSDDVLSGMDLQDKRILVTGVSAGLGVETARALVAHGANVVGTARNLAKAKQATDGIRSVVRFGGGSLELIDLDLADLTNVRSCADRLLADGRLFDLIISNAGVMATPFGLTVDGFEMQFATNHVGHFVLVNRIASLLRDGGRLVTLSSAAHHISDVSLVDPNFAHTDYDPWVAYGRSKTAVALFAVAFDKRHRDRGVRATTVHPGGIQTELGRHIPAKDAQALTDQMNEALAAAGKPPFKWKSIPQGAATSIWAGITADADIVGSHYCEDCHVASINDGPTMAGVRSYALDPEHAEALWAKSEELVGEHF